MKSKLFFRKHNAIGKPLVRLTEGKKKRKMQITKLRNESGDNTTNLIEIKIVREYYEQLYANKLDNLNEMNEFLEIHK